MRAEDRKRFAEIMTFMGEVYDKTFTAERLRAWFDLLQDHAIEDIELAARDHMRASRFMPTPAELIDRMQPNTEQTAALAWVEVPRLLRNSRAARSEDPITERVVRDLGGWIALGQKTAAELVWVEKEFVNRYGIYAEHGVDAAEKVPQLAHQRGGLQLIGGSK